MNIPDDDGITSHANIEQLINCIDISIRDSGIVGTHYDIMAALMTKTALYAAFMIDTEQVVSSFQRDICNNMHTTIAAFLKAARKKRAN